MPMSTYLVAIAVSDFDYVEVTSQGGALIGNKKQVNNYLKVGFIRSSLHKLHVSYSQLPAKDEAGKNFLLL